MTDELLNLDGEDFEEDDAFEEGEDIFDEVEEDEFAQFLGALGDAEYITITTNGGGSKIVLMSQMGDNPTIANAFIAANLYAQGEVQYYVDEIEVDTDFVLAAGQTVAAVGNVKGA